MLRARLFLVFLELVHLIFVVISAMMINCCLGLTLATSGVVASFRVHFRDSFGNRFLNSLNASSVVVFANDRGSVIPSKYFFNNVSKFDAVSSPDALIGYYSERMGDIHLRVMLLSAFGACATYYSEATIFPMVSIPVLSVIGTSLGNMSLISSTLNPMSSGVSVWSALYSPVSANSVFWIVCADISSIRFSVSNMVLLEIKFDSQIISTLFSAPHLFNDLAAMYEIRLEYWSLPQISTVNLRVGPDFSSSVPLPTMSMRCYSEIPNRELLSMNPSIACTTTSILSVVTLMTVGVPSVASLRVLDEYFNSRTESPLWFAKICYTSGNVCRDQPGSSASPECCDPIGHSLNASLSISVVKSGIARVVAEMQCTSSQTLASTLVGNCSSLKMRFENNGVVFFGRAQESPQCSYFKGFLRFSNAGNYFVKLNTTDGSTPRMWIGSQGLLTRLTFNNSGVASIVILPSMTVSTVDIEWLPSNNTSFIFFIVTDSDMNALSMSNSSLASRCQLNAVDVMVLSGETCASKSIVSDANLTIVAGATVTIGIISRDSFGNLNNPMNSFWTTSAKLMFPGGSLGEDLIFTADLQPSAPSSFFLKITRSGSYRVDIMKAEGAGLISLYYESMEPDSSNYLTDDIESGINFLWNYSSSVSSKRLFGSVRLQGWISSPADGPISMRVESDGRYRVAVGEDLRIECWSLKDNCVSEISKNTAIWKNKAQGYLYPIKIDIRPQWTSIAPYFRLVWFSMSMPVSDITINNLWASWTGIFSSPLLVTVEPAAISPVQSNILTDSSFSIATAGVYSIFSIMPVDSFGNAASAGFPQSLDPRQWMISGNCEGSPIALSYAVHPNNPKQGLYHHLTIMSTRASTANLFVAYADTSRIGLWATMYTSSSFEKASVSVFFSGQMQYPSIRSLLVASIPPTFLLPPFINLKFAAAFQPISKLLHKFQVDSSAQVQYLNMSINHVQFASLNSTIPPMYLTPTHDGFIRTIISISFANDTSFGFSFNLPEQSSQYIVPYAVIDVDKPPVLWHVNPSAAVLTSTTIRGTGLSLATAGSLSKFFVSAYDEYGNLRSHFDSGLRVHCSIRSNTFVSSWLGSLSSPSAVQYLVTSSGSFMLSVKLGSYALNSELLVVGEGSACAGRTYASGNALSIATAGSSSTFYVVLTDAFGQIRSTALENIFVQVYSHDFSEKHTVGVDYFMNKTLFTGQVSNTVSFRTTKSGRFFIQIQVLEAIGLSARYRLTSLQPSEIVGSKYEASIFQCTNESLPFGMNEFFPSYSGFIRSVTSGLYTFQFSSMSNVDRFVLIVDDQRLIDSGISSSAVVSATIALGSATMYNLRIELSAVLNLNRFCLQWAYNSSFSQIPSSNLFSNSHHIRGSPFSLTVFPAAFSASASRAFGSGVSLATCGQASTFFILLRDSFGNNVTYNQSLHGFAVHLRYRFTVPSFGKSLSRGIITPYADSLVMATYRAFVVRHERESQSDAFGQWQEMIISNYVAGSLIATYFSLSDGGSKVNATAMTSNAFEYNSNFVVRFSGFFTRESTEWKFVKITVPASSILKSSTTILGFQLVADVASNSSHSSFVQFDISTLDVHCLGDVFIEISGQSDSKMSSLRFEYVSDTNFTQIPSDKLFARHDIPVNTMYGSGLVATYYTASTSKPASSFSSTSLEWSTSNPFDRPFGMESSSEMNILRWNGMLTVSRPSVYTFSVLKAQEDTISMLINGLSFVEQRSQATSLTGTILLAEPLTFEILVTHVMNTSASSHSFALNFTCCNLASGSSVPPSAFKRKMAAHTIDFHDKSSYQWPSGRDIRHSSDGIPMARGIGKIYAQPARLLVLPFNEISEGGSSIEESSLTTVAAAGIISTFVVYARDQWSNRVASDSSRDIIASRLVPSLHDPDNQDSNPAFMISGWEVERISDFSTVLGPHTLFYTVTRSGKYWLQTIVARTEGMIAIVRPRTSGSDSRLWQSEVNTIHQPTSNFSFADNLNEILIQCSGLLKIEHSGYVTIYVQSSVQFVLWIDGRMLLKASSIDEREWSGEFWSPGSALHNILLNIENSSSVSKRVLMQYSSAHVPKQVIPTEVLAPYYHFISTSNTFNWKIGPVDIFDFNNIPTPPLVFPEIAIQPSAVCASASLVKLFVTIATAGSPVKFLVRALDMYGNQRSQTSDCFNLGQYASDACFFIISIPDGPMISSAVSSPTESAHEFIANVMVTTAGALFDPKVASAQIVQKGGLFATYFCDMMLAVPKVSIVQSPVLEMDSGMYTPAPIYDCLNNGVFSVRWSGFLQCSSEGVGTAHVSAASSIKISVASKDVLRIANGTLSSFSATFASAGFIMDVMIEYISSDDRNQFLQIDFFCNSTSSSSPAYFFGSHLSPSQQFVVIAGAACASLSNVWGSGLSIATSGSSSFVRMSFKDSFGNVVDFYNGRNADDIVTAALHPMSIYIWPCRTCTRPLFVSNAPMHCGLCQITKASQVNLPIPQPSLSFVPERVGDYKLVVSTGHKYGLTATYYSGCGLLASEVKNIGFPFSFSKAHTQLRDSLPSAFACDAAGIKGNISLPVAVRWRGFMVFPYAPMEYRLFAMGEGEFAVWFSSKLLLDKRDGHWSASVFINSDKVAYDIEITYYSNFSNCWFNLGWESEVAVWGSIWPSVLHSRHDIPTNGMLNALSKGSVPVTSIMNGTIVITASVHNLAINSFVVFVISELSSFSQALDCSPIYTVSNVLSPQSLKVSTTVHFPSVGEFFVMNAWYVKMSASMFFTSTPHGFTVGDFVLFVDGQGSNNMNRVGGNSVWTCLSSIRDYIVASVPTSSSFALADSADTTTVLNFSCTSNSIFIVRRSLQNRLIVRSGDFCASRSFVLGQNLSLATAGTLFSFAVQLRDSFQNMISQNSALISVNCFENFTNTGADHHIQRSIVMNDGHPAVLLRTTVSGIYKITIFDVSNGAQLDNSPVVLRVLPNSFCAASSSMQRIMTSIIMNWPSRMEFYAHDHFGNILTETLAGYTTSIASCKPDAGYIDILIASHGGLGVSFSKSSEPCVCCKNQYVSVTTGPIFNGNGTSSILSTEHDASGVLTDVRTLFEGSSYVLKPTAVLLSYPLFAVKMVLVNGSDSITMVLAYSDVKISNGSYSVLHSYPANPGRGRVMTIGLALLHGGLLATYYALDAQLPLAADVSVFGSSSWATKLTPCAVGVMGSGLTLNTTLCRANSKATAVKFSGIVHREGRMAPLIMFMVVHKESALKLIFASRIVTDATIVSQGDLKFYSAVVPLVPSNYKKILTDFDVEYAGAAIPSYSFPLFAGTACSKVFAISSIAAFANGSSSIFYTGEKHGYTANTTFVRLFGSLPSPLSRSILYRVSDVNAPSAFSLSILGEFSSVFNISGSSYNASSAFVEEVHGACGVRAPFELGSSYVSVSLV